MTTFLGFTNTKTASFSICDFYFILFSSSIIKINLQFCVASETYANLCSV